MTDTRHDHIKWFAIGFLSALGVLSVVVVILFYSFTPLMKVDETTGRLQFLGGLIDVQARDVITQLSKEGSFVFGTIEGVEAISEDTEWIAIKFGAGEIRVDYNNSDEMNWDCDGAGKNAKVVGDLNSKTVYLDFSSAFVDCDVSVPVKKVRVEGMNGEIEVRKIQADLDVKLTSGDIFLDPISEKKYSYNLKAGTGNVDDTLSSEDSVNKDPKKSSESIKIKAEIKVGNIQRLD